MAKPNNTDKMIEARLVDLSYRFKAIENIINWFKVVIDNVKKFNCIIIAICIVVAFVFYINDIKEDMIMEIKETHKKTTAKIKRHLGNYNGTR